MRYTISGINVIDNYSEKIIAETLNEEMAENIARILNEKEEEYQILIEKSINIQEEHKETLDKLDNILKLIDLKIEENTVLSKIHYTTLEDNYQNEYEVRITELTQLKKLILEKSYF